MSVYPTWINTGTTRQLSKKKTKERKSKGYMMIMCSTGFSRKQVGFCPVNCFWKAPLLLRGMDNSPVDITRVVQKVLSLIGLLSFSPGIF